MGVLNLNLLPDKPTAEKKPKILDIFTDVTLDTEGLGEGQTPLRDEKLSKGGRKTSRFKNTVQGYNIDWDAWEKAPEDRKNFYYVSEEDKPKVIRKQFQNYITNPEKYGLTEESTIEDVVSTFDKERPINKTSKLQNLGVDIKTKIKDLSNTFDISSLNPLAVKEAQAGQFKLNLDTMPDKPSKLKLDLLPDKPAQAEKPIPTISMPDGSYRLPTPQEKKQMRQSFIARKTDIPEGQIAEEFLMDTVGYITFATAFGGPSGIGAYSALKEYAKLEKDPEIARLSPVKKAARVAVAGAGGYLMGKMFNIPNYGKTIIGKVITAFAKSEPAGQGAISAVINRSIGSGATVVTEELIKDAVSGNLPDTKKAISSGIRTAAMMAITGAVLETPAFRGKIISEANRVADRAGKPRPASYQEARQLLFKSGIEPERLSRYVQKATYQTKKDLVIKDIGRISESLEVSKKEALSMLNEKNLKIRSQTVDAWFAKLAKINPDKAIKLAPFRDAIAKGVDPVDLYMQIEMDRIAGVKTEIVAQQTAQMESSQAAEAQAYNNWLQSKKATIRTELDVPLHPAPKTSVDLGVEQRMFPTPIAPKVEAPKPTKKKDLISVIKERGGLDTEQIKKDYNWNEAVKGNKIPIGVFKKGASGLDDMAGQLQSEGLLKVPEGVNPGDYLMQQLQGEQSRKADLFAQDLESQYDTEYEQFLKEEESKYGTEEIRRAEKEVEADIEKEIEGEVDTEEIPDVIDGERELSRRESLLRKSLSKDNIIIPDDIEVQAVVENPYDQKKLDIYGVSKGGDGHKIFFTVDRGAGDVTEIARKAEAKKIKVTVGRVKATSTGEVEGLDKKEGKIDSERLYLLKQDAELYPKVEQFIESMKDSDLTKAQLTDIWNKAQGEEKAVEFKGEFVDAVVHKSAKKPGKWQATFIQKDGKPSGDVIRDTYEKAVEEARLTTGVLSDEQKAAAARLDKPQGREAEEHPSLAALRKTTLSEYNTNKAIVEADAFVDEIRELDPKKEDDKVWIKHGSKYEVTVSYPHSLGENGNATTFNYNEKPTVEDIKKDILQEYKDFKKEVNEEMVMGVVAKSGRDENIEEAIDKVLQPKGKLLEEFEKHPVAKKMIKETLSNEVFWGKKIATIVKDPRNITKEEWKKLDSIYQKFMTAEAYDEWENAKSSATQISVSRGNIKLGPGEGKSRQEEYYPDKREKPPEHLQKTVDKEKGIEDVTPKGYGPAKVTSSKAVYIGRSPQKYTILKKVPREDIDLPDEVFYEVKNNKTGEVQVVEKNDISKKPTGARGATPGSSAAVAARGTGYGGIIEPSEKSSKEKVAKTDYAKVGEEIPSKEENNLIKEALKIVAPSRVSGATEEASLVLRKGLADLAHKDVLAIEAMKKAHSAFTWMSTEDVHEFIDNMETGKPQDNPKLQPFANIMRSLLDQRRDAIQGLGKGQLESYYDNYFPHIWKDPKAMKDLVAQIMGRKRLEGTKSFLKKRVIITVKDGLDRGLELVSDNPVDLVLLKLHEMDRYIMSQNIIRGMKAKGLTKFVYSRKKPPEGYSKINDYAFTVFMPPEITKKEAYDSIMVDQLMDISKGMNIDTKRFVSIGTRGWGWAKNIKDGQVRTKFASPESVLAHEIGHVIGYRYGIHDMLGRRKEGEYKIHEKGKKAGERYFKPAKEAVEYRREIDKQWRNLADARFKGSEAPDSYKKYVRNKREKEAVLLEALIHAPKEFKRIAPDLYDGFTKFLNANGELRPLLDIEPSLVLGESDAKIKVPGFTTLGHYYAPADVARLINNHLSPGLKNAENKLISGSYNILRGAGNILNQVNLSLSAFHAINVSTDMMASTLGLGLRKLMTKDQRLGGLKDIITTAVAPIEGIWQGSRLKKAYRQQIDTITDPKLKTMVESIIVAGGRDRMDVFYYNQQMKALTKTFQDVFKGSGIEKLTGVLRLPFNAFGATLEVLAKPIMEWYVPTGKMGLFSKLATHEMQRAEGGEITDEQLIGRLASVWDSVDNRMGQLIYDNLFWDKVLKDSLMLAIRSVGWNLGSWREYAGAGVDLVTFLDRAKKGDKFFSQKMSYVTGAAIVYATLGAIITYILTGEKPREMKDYFFPRTGRKNPDGSDERLSLPTYAKDVYAYSQRPFQTIRNKAHPLLGLISEEIKNEDFFSVQIANPKDPFYDELLSRAKHIVNYSKPFSFKNYDKMQKAGEGGKATAFVSITGITSAPAYVTRSAAQKLMYRYVIDRIPDTTRTKEQFAKSEYRKTLKNRIRKGEKVDYKEAVNYLGIKSFKRTVKEAALPSFAALYKRLSIEEALNVYAIATQKEKNQTKDILIDKFKRAHKQEKTSPYMVSMFRELLSK